MTRKRAFSAAPGTTICTQVDAEGTELTVEFDADGVLETSDPGLLPVLERLVADGRIAAGKPKTEEKDA